MEIETAEIEEYQSWDYGHHISFRPPSPPDLQTFLRPRPEGKEQPAEQCCLPQILNDLNKLGVKVVLAEPVKCTLKTLLRYRLRFFDHVGHQTTSAFIENKHFFTTSCHLQTYQNYELPPQSLQNLDFQNHFSASKINQTFLIFLYKEY